MYLSEGESFLTSSLSYRYCLGIKLYSFSSRNPFHRQFFHATQKKPVNWFVCGCINFIVTHQVYKYWRIGRQTTFFGRELLINKITTRGNRKYCNIRNDDVKWPLRILLNSITATSTKNRIYIIFFYIISSNFVCRIVYFIFLRE